MKNSWEKKKTRSHRCTCGRTFFHRISLERHLKVSGCQGAEEQSAPDDDLTTQEETVQGPQAAAEDSAPEPVEEEVAPLRSEPRTSELIWATTCEFSLWLVQMVRLGALDTRRMAQRGTSDGTRLLTERVLPVLREATLRAAGILLVLGLSLLIVRPLFAGQARGPNPVRMAAPAHAVQPVVPASRPSPASADPGQAVQEFYHLVDQGRLGRAYARLSPAWQRESSYATFESGYTETSRVRCRVLGANSLSPDRARVDVALEVLEGQSTVSYLGSYVVVRGSQGWVLDRGVLTPAPG